jgi:hypothetical protein
MGTVVCLSILRFPPEIPFSNTCASHRVWTSQPRYSTHVKCKKLSYVLLFHVQVFAIQFYPSFMFVFPEGSSALLLMRFQFNHGSVWSEQDRDLSFSVGVTTCGELYEWMMGYWGKTKEKRLNLYPLRFPRVRFISLTCNPLVLNELN